MEEKTLFKIALLITVIGLAFLFFYAEEFSVRSVETIDNIPNEEEVQMEGVIKRLTKADKVFFLELEGQRVEKTAVILFNDQDVFLHEGDYVEIFGSVEDYQGKKEIIASKIVVK